MMVHYIRHGFKNWFKTRFLSHHNIYVFHTRFYFSCLRVWKSSYNIQLWNMFEMWNISIRSCTEVEFLSLVKRKCFFFKCDWFDPVVNMAVQYNKLGVLDINAARKYNKFEPLILTSQTEDVCFITSPRITESGNIGYPQ